MFRDFAFPDWGIFLGNLLMLVTCAFYVAWWAVAFSPTGSGRTPGASVLIGIAILAGISSVALISLACGSIPSSGKGLPPIVLLVGAAVAYVIILAVTKAAFHRPVTSELLIMIVWATVESAAINGLRCRGRFGMPQTIALAALVAAATCVGIVCYLSYYRLDKVSSYRTGFIPLIADGAVVAAFLAAHAFS
jgi:hypothetical protein